MSRKVLINDFILVIGSRWFDVSLRNVCGWLSAVCLRGDHVLVIISLLVRFGTFIGLFSRFRAGSLRIASHQLIAQLYFTVEGFEIREVLAPSVHRVVVVIHDMLSKHNTAIFGRRVLFVIGFGVLSLLALLLIARSQDASVARSVTERCLGRCDDGVDSVFLFRREDGCDVMVETGVTTVTTLENIGFVDVNGENDEQDGRGHFDDRSCAEQGEMERPGVVLEADAFVTNALVVPKDARFVNEL